MFKSLWLLLFQNKNSVDLKQLFSPMMFKVANLRGDNSIATFTDPDNLDRVVVRLEKNIVRDATGSGTTPPFMNECIKRGRHYGVFSLRIEEAIALRITLEAALEDVERKKKAWRLKDLVLDFVLSATSHSTVEKKK